MLHAWKREGGMGRKRERGMGKVYVRVRSPARRRPGPALPHPSLAIPPALPGMQAVVEVAGCADQ